MTGEATEIGRFGRFRVLHERGSDVATVAGMIHSETLDLAGWRSRRLFYARLRAGPSGAFYSDNLAASECAVAVLELA